MVSYSFHISKGDHAITTLIKLEQAAKHNARKYESKDYDRSQIEILAGSDNLVDDVKQIYHDEFDDALKAYNDKQTRSDRKIKNYLKHVSDSRSDVAVEIIIQIGDINFWAQKTMDERKQMHYIFKDQLRYMRDHIPDFKIASAIVHYDEKSPHMHVVGVPVATGYKKGMEKQCAKTKVFTAMSLSHYQDIFRARAEAGMALPKNHNLFGFDTLKAKEKGRNKDIPKWQLDAYYAAKNDIDNAKSEMVQFDQKREAASKEYNETKIKIEKAENQLKILEADVQNAKDKSESLEQEIANLLKTKEETELYNDIIRGDVKLAAQELERIKTEERDLGRTIVALHKQKAENEQNIDAQMQKLIEAKDDLEDILRVKKSTNDDIDMLRTSRANILDEITQLERQRDTILSSARDDASDIVKKATADADRIVESASSMVAHLKIYALKLRDTLSRLITRYVPILDEMKKDYVVAITNKARIISDYRDDGMPYRNTPVGWICDMLRYKKPDNEAVYPVYEEVDMDNRYSMAIDPERVAIYHDGEWSAEQNTYVPSDNDWLPVPYDDGIHMIDALIHDEPDRSDIHIHKDIDHSTR